MAEESPTKQPLGQGTMTKKRYYEIQKRLEDEMKLSSDTVLQVMTVIKDVLNFDPNVTLYDERSKQRLKEYREKKKQEGISTYITSGTKAYYYKTRIAT